MFPLDQTRLEQVDEVVPTSLCPDLHTKVTCVELTTRPIPLTGISRSLTEQAPKIVNKRFEYEVET